MRLVNRIEGHQNIQRTEYKQKVERSIEFNRILQDIQVNKELKLSAHAEDRLRQRNITLSDSDLVNLNSAVNKIRNKGGSEALIVYNNIAFITSIKNNTIITAVDSDSLKENIFTNIDSAMIL
jgi:flagellar operon protein